MTFTLYINLESESAAAILAFWVADVFQRASMACLMQAFARVEFATKFSPRVTVAPHDEAQPAVTAAAIVGRRLVASEEGAAVAAACVRGRHGHELGFRQTSDVPVMCGGRVRLVPQPTEVRWLRHRGLR